MSRLLRHGSASLVLLLVLQVFAGNNAAFTVTSTLKGNLAGLQRRRETGSLAPRKQTKFRARVLAGQEDRLAGLILATPDATLAELREALPTTAALSTLWLEIDRLGLTVKKNCARRRTAST